MTGFLELINFKNSLLNIENDVTVIISITNVDVDSIEHDRFILSEC